MSDTREVVVLFDSGETGLRFAEALRQDVEQGRFGAPNSRSVWRLSSGKSKRDVNDETRAPVSVRLMPPSLTTLPEIEVHFFPASHVDLGNGAARTTGAAVLAAMSRADAIILLSGVDESATRWPELATAMLRGLRERRDKREERVDIAIALASPRTAWVVQHRGKLAPFVEAAHVLFPHVAQLEKFTFGDDGAATEDVTGDHEVSKPEGAAGILRWCVTALKPQLLTPGLSGTINRTPAPGLAWYTAGLWIVLVLAPTVGQRAMVVACSVAGLEQCRFDAARASNEMRDLDPTTVMVALLLSLVVKALLPRQAYRETKDARHHRARSETFRRWSAAAIGGAWTTALFPRALMVSTVTALSGAGVTLPRQSIERALDAEDLRPPILISGLLLTLAAAVTAQVVSARRARAIHIERTRVRQTLAPQERAR